MLSYLYNAFALFSQAVRHVLRGDCWRNRTQEKSYPREIVPKLNGYDFTRDIVPRVRFLQRYRTLGTKFKHDIFYNEIRQYTFSQLTTLVDIIK